MIREVMKKWVRALRSGKYKQGTGTLKQFNEKGGARHCCLGVLCEVYNQDMKKNKKKVLPEKFIDRFPDRYTKFGNRTDDLPKEVKEWAGVRTNLGIFKIERTDYCGKYMDKECLADLNDTGKKFSTIADIIEKNYENI